MLTSGNRFRKVEGDPALAAFRWVLRELLDWRLVLDEELLADLERFGWKSERVCRLAAEFLSRGELEVVHGSRPVTYVLLGGRHDDR